MKPKILITLRFPESHFASLAGDFEVLMPRGRKLTAEELDEYLPQVSGIIASVAFAVTDELMGRAPLLRVVASYGVGYDNIDVAAAMRRGIVVTNNPRPVLEPTAEQAYALMLALARRIPECDRALREGRARWGIMDNLGTTLYGKTLGVVGMGRIGRAVRRYAAASRMRVLYHNRHRMAVEEEWDMEVEYADFDTLLKESDVVSIHLPLSPESHHLFGAAEFGRMKRSAFLVNTARGAVVDERALVEALRSGVIAGAALDVFENEPHIQPELLAMENVVLAPHAGTATVEAREDMSFHAARNIKGFFAGDPDIDRVNS